MVLMVLGVVVVVLGVAPVVLGVVLRQSSEQMFGTIFRANTARTSRTGVRTFRTTCRTSRTTTRTTVRRVLIGFSGLN